MGSNPRICSGSTAVDGTEDASDGLNRYEIQEEIGRGATSVVYRAICKRGRLRNRHVALKKILSVSAHSETEVAHLSSSTSLHQALHHPSIVSLFSTFSTPSGCYHVLEYCSRGTLMAFLQSRQPPVLSESELRGVLRNLVDALIYLKNEHILHRDVKASNVLLTEDFRVKLSDFGLAVRLPAIDSTTSTFCGSPNYIAPEIVSRVPYGFSADLWSLGCLIVTCLSGFSAFEAPNVEEIFANITRGKYLLPDTISFEAKDLVTGLLQRDPTHRIPLHRILSHPFFKPSLPVQPLSSPQYISSRAAFNTRNQKENSPPLRVHNYNRYPRSLSKGSPTNKRHMLSSRTNPVQPIHARKPLANTINRDLRNILSDELSNPLTSPLVGLDRRVYSAPTSSQTVATGFTKPQRPGFPSRIHSVPTTPALTVDSGSPSSPTGTVHNVDECTPEVGKGDSVLIRHPLLSHPGSRTSSYAHQGQAKSLAPVVSSIIKRSPAQPDNTPSIAARRSSTSHNACPLSPPTSAVLLGSTRPTPFSTAYLNPQTHKVTQGQLVVLPSKCALVDFREGERRKGRKGNEVLVVSSEGRKVDPRLQRPHLSTPCCLAEPIATYVIDDLPAAYWKSYNDAGRLVDQLKQRIPKLVLYEPAAKCTLMANEPHGDIELLFPYTELSNGGKKSGDDAPSAKGANMRIRLWRRNRSVEVARYIPPVSQARVGTGEWLKKILPATGSHSIVPEEYLVSLGSMEITGIRLLGTFLHICETLEALGTQEDGMSMPSDAPQAPEDIERRPSGEEQDGRRRLGEVLFRMENHSQPLLIRTSSADKSNEETLLTVATTASAKVLPSLNLPPRPSKFSPMPRHLSGVCQGVLQDDSGSGSRTGVRSLSTTGSKPGAHQSIMSDDPEGDTPQTRFIPSVGWCIHHAHRGAQRYRIMFHDGASLEVQSALQDGEAVRYTGSAKELPIYLSREAAEKRFCGRMEAFDEFVALFSDG